MFHLRLLFVMIKIDIATCKTCGEVFPQSNVKGIVQLVKVIDNIPIMQCVKVCLEIGECDALMLGDSYCKLFHAGGTSENVHVPSIYPRNILWPQRFVPRDKIAMRSTLPTTDKTTSSNEDDISSTSLKLIPTTYETTSSNEDDTSSTSLKSIPTTYETTSSGNEDTLSTSLTSLPTDDRKRTPLVQDTCTSGACTSVAQPTTIKAKTTVVEKTSTVSVTTLSNQEKNLASKYTCLDPSMCVRFYDGSSKVTWFQARATCQSQGGDLVTLDTRERVDTFYEHVKSLGKTHGMGTVIKNIFGRKKRSAKKPAVWIGLKDTASGWTWVNGSPFKFDNFGLHSELPGSQRCGSSNLGPIKKWIPFNCKEKTKMFACEIVPNGAS